MRNGEDLYNYSFCLFNYIEEPLSITRNTVQSLGRVRLSSRYLLWVSRSIYRFSLVCVNNFESFSIDWCRYEVISMPNLFSVPVWKCEVFLWASGMMGHTFLMHDVYCRRMNYGVTAVMKVPNYQSLCVWGIYPLHFKIYWSSQTKIFIQVQNAIISLKLAVFILLFILVYK